MDPLKLLTDVTGTNVHLPKELILREVMKGVLIAAFGLAWAVVLVAMIALTAVLALEPEFGAAQAAAITTGGFVLVGVIAALVMRRPAHKPAENLPAPQRAHGGLAENGDMLRVHSAWDVATLVALGVLAGFQQRRKPG